MKTALACAWRIALCVALLALGAVFVETAHTIKTARAEIQGLREAALAEIARQGDETRAAAEALASRIEADARAEIAAIRRDLMKRADAGIAIADKRLVSVEALLDARSRQVVDQVHQVNTTLASVAKPTAELIQQIDEAAPLYLDCEGNPSCAYNLFQGTAKALERTSQAIQKSVPGLLETAQVTNEHLAGVTGDVHKATAKFVAPKKWYIRVGAAVIGAGVIAAKVIF